MRYYESWYDYTSPNIVSGGCYMNEIVFWATIKEDHPCVGRCYVPFNRGARWTEDVMR